MANPAKNQKTAQPAKLSVEELKSAAGADQDVKALNIFEKLSRVRVWFAENGIRSSGYNEFSKWSYVQLSDFLPEATILFDAFHLLPVVTFPDASSSVLTLYDMDKPESLLVFSAPMGMVSLKGCHDAQNVGAQQTYARRYLYLLVLDLVESDGLDGQPPVDPEEEIKALKAQIKTAIDEILTRAPEDQKAAVRTRIIELSKKHLGTADYTRLKAGDELRAGAFLSELNTLDDRDHHE